MSKQSTPADFGESGARMWGEISSRWNLRPDELRILEDACREADLIDDLADAARGADKLVRGSQGQMVINPLISELRMHRATLASLTAKLALPDENNAEARSTAARKAAQARWSKTG